MLSDAVPNLLIGLREGLEAGLIVSILVGAVVRGGRRDRLRELWGGVISAAGLSLAFGAILTYAAADLSTAGQEAVGGILSIIAVGLVTWMVFWMRRAARTLSKDLRSRTQEALIVGGPTLFVLAFFAVAREGLETALFVWSTTRTANKSTGPLIGAGFGLIAAAVLCWALYRQALRLNLSRFFTWTGGALIVVAAGVLGYGLRELQGAGILPGGSRHAFDFTAQLDPSSWYARLVEGAFNLTPTMTVLQVFGYAGYLVAVMVPFILMTRRSAQQAARPITPVSTPPIEKSTGKELVPVANVASAARHEESPTPLRPKRSSSRQRNVVMLGSVVGFALVTVAIIAAIGPKRTANATAIAATSAACAPGWSAPESGQRTFDISNTSSQMIEIYLMDANRTTARGEIEGLGAWVSNRH